MGKYQRCILNYMKSRARRDEYIHRPTTLKKKLGFTVYLWTVLKRLMDKDIVGKYETREGLKGSYYYLVDYEKKAREEMLRRGLVDDNMFR